MQYIHIDIDNLTAKSKDFAISGSQNSYTVIFNGLPDKWKDLKRYVLFTKSKCDTPIAVEMDDNFSAIIPDEILSEYRSFYIGAFCTSLDENNPYRENIVPILIKMKEGSYMQYGISPDPSVLGIFEKYLSEIIEARDNALNEIDKKADEIADEVQSRVKNGKSAYEIAVDDGYIGSEEEWLASLKGEQGIQGIQGEKGEPALINGSPAVQISTDKNLEIERDGENLKIKLTLPLNTGAGEGSICSEFSKSNAIGDLAIALCEGALALTRNSIAANKYAVAGTKVFLVTASEKISDTEGIYTVEENANGLEAGDTITLQFDKLYPDIAEIRSIDGNRITVTGAFVEYKTTMPRNYLKVLTKPHVGTATDDSNQAVCFSAEGVASGAASFAANFKTLAYQHYSAAFNCGTKAGYAAFSTGINTWAKGAASFTAGQGSQATEEDSVAMGQASYAKAYAAFAMGISALSIGRCAATLGYHSTASGDYATAFGYWTKAFGFASFAANYAQALEKYSAALGNGTIANRPDQFVAGRFNDTNSTALFVIGNGTDSNHRSNAFEAFEDGTIKIGGTKSDPYTENTLVNVTSITANTAQLDTNDGTFSVAPDITTYLDGTTPYVKNWYNSHKGTKNKIELDLLLAGITDTYNDTPDDTEHNYTVIVKTDSDQTISLSIKTGYNPGGFPEYGAYIKEARNGLTDWSTARIIPPNKTVMFKFKKLAKTYTDAGEHSSHDYILYDIIPLNGALNNTIEQPPVIGTLKTGNIYSVDHTANSSIVIKLPEGGVGDFIQYDFVTGTTAPTVTIQSTYGMTEFDFTPEASKIYSLFFDWGIIAVENSANVYGWRISYAEYDYTPSTAETTGNDTVVKANDDDL